MKTKFYVLAAILGALVLFVWGAFSHMALPWWDDVMRQVPNEQVVVDAMKSAGVQNGMYYGMQGMFLVTFFGKGMSDGVSMGPLMLMEFISNMLVAWALAWLLLRSSVSGVLNRGYFAAVIGLLSWLAVNVSSWIWYNFAFAYILLEAADNVIGLFLAGLVIGWLMKKYAPARVAL